MDNLYFKKSLRAVSFIKIIPSIQSIGMRSHLVNPITLKAPNLAISHFFEEKENDKLNALVCCMTS